MSLQIPPKAVQQQFATVAIRTYAAAGYRYYVMDDPTLTDAEFDELCHWLSDNFEWIKPFDLSGYLEMESLDAGSGYAIAAKVCGQTKDYAIALKDALTVSLEDTPGLPSDSKLKKARKPRKSKATDAPATIGVDLGALNGDITVTTAVNKAGEIVSQTVEAAPQASDEDLLADLM